MRAPAAHRPSPLRDLPWLSAWMLRTAPAFTALWAALILADAVFAALRLWATRGTVNAVVAFAQGAAHGFGPTRWFVLIAAIETAARCSGLLRPYVRERVRVAAGFAIHNAALRKAAAVPIDSFDVEATHDVLRRVADGADSRGPDLVAEALGLLQQVPTVVVYAIALGVISRWLPFAAAAMEAVFIWQMIAQGSRERQFEVDWTRQRRLTDYYAHLLTSRAAAAEVRLWGLRPELLRRWRAGQTAYAMERNRLELRETRQFLPSTVLASGFLIIAVGVLSAVHGRVEPGLAALFLTAFFGVMAGMNTLQHSVRQFVGHAGYGTDLREVVEGLPVEDTGAHATASSAGNPTPASAPNPDSTSLAPRASLHVVPPTPPSTATSPAPAVPFPRPIREGLRFHGVSYRYPAATHDALREVSFEIAPGEVVAVVGANGAGKTTLASLLLGLRRPSAGRVAVDGTDLANITPSALREQCAAVFQQPVRYPATLRENVTLAVAAGPTSPSLGAALRTTGLDGITGDPLLSPEFGGVDLSGGQWQRLSIARALYRPEAQVLVFDEPTAALDPLAELELFERFAHLAAGRTTVLISHRLGPTRLADRVLVLEGGRLVEQGPPQRLLAAGGLFARMFEAQGEWYR